MKMVKSINFKWKKIKIIFLFFFILLLSQSFLPRVAADELADGPLKISSGDWINIQKGTNIIIFWQFNVSENERAIYWEVEGYDVFQSGWGPDANCTTPILNETDTTYEYHCHGYYAKYYVYSTIIITCTETGQPNDTEQGVFDPFFLSLPKEALLMIFSFPPLEQAPLYSDYD